MRACMKSFLIVLALCFAGGCAYTQPSAPEALAFSEMTEIVLKAAPNAGSKWPKSAVAQKQLMKKAQEVIDKRLKGMRDLTTYRVALRDDNNLVILVSKDADTKKIIKQATSDASINFYYLKNVENRNNPLGTWRMDFEDSGYVFSDGKGNKIDSNQQPAKVMSRVVQASRNPPVITGASVLPNAKASRNQRGQIVISIEFDRNGTRKFEDFTRKHVQDYLAVFYGNRLLTAPTIMEAISGGQAEITGFKTLAEAKEVANQVNSGMLPVPLEVVGK